MSMTVMKKAVGAGLLVSLVGTGVALAAFEKGESAAQSGASAGGGIDAVAAEVALERWHEYMRSIGWPEDLVQETRPAFLNAAASKERLADGTWKLIFDGTRTGELRMVEMHLDDRGTEVGETFVEWSDMCTIEDIRGEVCR